MAIRKEKNDLQD